MKLFGALCAISADNPASTACGGFKESAIANRPCRHCMATQADISSSFQERDFVLRNTEDHEQYLEEIEEDEQKSVEYGINRRSVLDELKYFDVSSGALLSDIMHDVLEGALQYEAKLVLQKFVFDDHYFSLDDLNQQIESIELGHAESKNRPSLISPKTLSSSRDNSLKQSGKYMQ